MTAYYNEFDPYAAQWLRNLIAAGYIAPGHVDERSITDVQPEDLAGYTQCHFFAGIGGWALAARLAGWPDDRELWTGSAPCQPFSVAGARRGADDERHLWPHLFRLIRARRPVVVMGEQVAAAVGAHWLDGVFADLEGVGYACGAAVVPACAVDAPHRRDRLWFFASRGRAVDHGERARDWKDTPGMTAQRADGRSRIDQLPRQAAAAMWPTPTAVDGNRGLTTRPQDTGKPLPQRVGEALGIPPAGSSATTEKPGALNPAFVCWLMGFPAAWDACAPTATPSSRKSRRK